MKIPAITLLLISTVLYSGCSRSKWTEYLPPGGNFSILMPGMPEKREAVIPLDSYGNQKMVFYSVNVGKANYSISYSDYPADFVRAAGADLLLGAGIQKYAAKPDIKIEHDEQGIALNCPTRKTEVIMTDVDYEISLQSYLTGNRVYIIQVVRPSGSIAPKVIARFLTSFRLLK